MDRYFRLDAFVHGDRHTRELREGLRHIVDVGVLEVEGDAVALGTRGRTVGDRGEKGVVLPGAKCSDEVVTAPGEFEREVVIADAGADAARRVRAGVHEHLTFVVEYDRL